MYGERLILILFGIALAIVCVANVFMFFETKEKPIQPYRNRYVIKRLNQKTFEKAVNEVKELVHKEVADIDIVYDGHVLFNGYIDIDDEGKSTPHYWYNKEILDINNINY